MTPDDYRLVRDLFERAVDDAPRDLESWLADQQVDDAIASEVRSLLNHHQRAGSFLVEPASSSVFPEENILRPGMNLGAYEIGDELGRGGMGRVYRAMDTRLGRPVAVKAIAPRLAHDAGFRERLRREARAMAALAHPGICAVYALEEKDDSLFLVTELVDGSTLRETIDRGERPDAGQALETARQLAEALAAAHAHGITHRDVKPANVMRASDGRLKVLDFGVAAVRAAQESALPALTLPGAPVGTPVYMAPEQLGDGAVDARADVFALGVVLYEYAAGAHPFHAQTEAQTVARILESQPVPLSSRRPDLPERLTAIVDRCLRKNPAERFASAVDVVAALADGVVLRDEPVRGVRWWRIHQIVIVGLYAVASIAAWEMKELGVAAGHALFITTGVLASLGGVVRGHLLFTERVHPARLMLERRRTRRVQTAVDLLLAALVFIGGGTTALTHAVPGVLAMGLAVGLALSAVLIEPSTSAAAFAEPPPP
jgi:hypothetical protein